MFVELTTIKGDTFAVNRNNVLLLGANKHGSCVVTVDGNVFDLAISYADLCALFADSALKTCQNV